MFRIVSIEYNKNAIQSQQKKYNIAFFYLIQSFFTFRTPITDVLRTYALGSVKHFCRGASTYSKMESSLRLQSDRRARPLTIGSSSSLWL